MKRTLFYFLLTSLSHITIKPKPIISKTQRGVVKTGLICLTILTFFNPEVAAQWSGSTTINGDLYRLGKVAIGTTVPHRTLTLHEPVLNAAHIQITNKTIGFGINDGLLIGEAAEDALFINREYGNMRFFTDNTERLKIDKEGRVSIRTGLAEADLQLNGSFIMELEKPNYFDTKARMTIEGSAMLPGLRYEISDDNGSTYSDILFLAENGRIGMGNIDPQEKLEVRGTIRATNPNSGSHFIRIGHDMANAYLESSIGKVHLNYVSGNDVAIGKAGTNTANLTVAGDITNCGFIHTGEVEVRSTWCDYVFDEGYDLRPLEQVEAYIRENGHLPNIPSAATVESEGLQLADMERRMMEKIEELTLYLIELNKQVKALEAENAKLRSK